eukprot:1180616-Rhodomonas_salina.6
MPGGVSCILQRGAESADRARRPACDGCNAHLTEATHQERSLQLALKVSRLARRPHPTASTLEHLLLIFSSSKVSWLSLWGSLNFFSVLFHPTVVFESDRHGFTQLAMTQEIMSVLRSKW